MTASAADPAKSRVTKRTLILVIILVHLVVGALAFGLPAIIGAIPPVPALIVGGLLFLFKAPTSAIVISVVTKPSNWQDGLVAMKVTCRRAGYLNGAFAGAMIGAHYWGNLGAILVGGALFLAGMYLGILAGPLLWKRLNPSVETHA